METIDSLRIYVARRGDLPLVLVPDADNIPTVVEPAPTLIRAEYILQDEATDDRLFQAAQRLEQTGMLLLMQPGVDGPNSRTAFVYPQPEDCTISAWHDAGGRSRLDRLQGHSYRASVLHGYETWQSASGRGKPALFVTGAPGKAHCWRVNSMDIDSSTRLLFSLSPVGLAAGFPEARFAIIQDVLLRGEAEAHWADLQAAFLDHRYRGAINAAKTLVETLLSYEFEGAEPNLDGLLKKLRKRLDDKTVTRVLKFSDLDYHSMQKLRLLHQRTHPGRVAVMQRSVRPELALGVAEDVIEILTSVGIC